MTCTGGRVVRPMLMALLRLGSSTVVIVRRPSPAFFKVGEKGGNEIGKRTSWGNN